MHGRSACFLKGSRAVQKRSGSTPPRPGQLLMKQRVGVQTGSAEAPGPHRGGGPTSGAFSGSLGTSRPWTHLLTWVVCSSDCPSGRSPRVEAFRAESMALVQPKPCSRVSMFRFAPAWTRRATTAVLLWCTASRRGMSLSCCTSHTPAQSSCVTTTSQSSTMADSSTLLKSAPSDTAARMRTRTTAVWLCFPASTMAGMFSRAATIAPAATSCSTTSRCPLTAPTTSADSPFSVQRLGSAPASISSRTIPPRPRSLAIISGGGLTPSSRGAEWAKRHRTVPSQLLDTARRRALSQKDGDPSGLVIAFPAFTISSTTAMWPFFPANRSAVSKVLTSAPASNSSRTTS
mmetsp:Transcript_133620/g.231747  ORF Transcript_133620/g.231747 Transcript_133620/m.231747 type:complete len:346 (-) Transcript_133620:1481-2518(-)